jgi:hypothetical protein
MSLALNLVSLFLSLSALGTSTFLLVRQRAFMRHANEIPVTIDLYQEFRSHEFQEAYGFVINSLASDYEPSSGISGLPEKARIPIIKVASFFTSLGGLVYFEMIDERLAVSLLGTAMHRTWDILEPYITREREIRGDDEIYVGDRAVGRSVTRCPPNDSPAPIMLSRCPRRSRSARPRSHHRIPGQRRRPGPVPGGLHLQRARVVGVQQGLDRWLSGARAPGPGWNDPRRSSTRHAGSSASGSRAPNPRRPHVAHRQDTAELLIALDNPAFTQACPPRTGGRTRWLSGDGLPCQAVMAFPASCSRSRTLRRLSAPVAP